MDVNWDTALEWIGTPRCMQDGDMVEFTMPPGEEPGRTWGCRTCGLIIRMSPAGPGYVTMAVQTREGSTATVRFDTSVRKPIQSDPR